MATYRIFAIMAAMLVTFGFAGTLMASPKTEDSKNLIKCSTCSMQFNAQAAAQQHVKIHPGHELTMPAQPLIQCSTCGIEFTSQVGLKKHLNETNGHKDAQLIKCSTCGVELTDPGLWKEHLKKHPDHSAM